MSPVEGCSRYAERDRPVRFFQGGNTPSRVANPTPHHRRTAHSSLQLRNRRGVANESSLVAAGCGCRGWKSLSPCPKRKRPLGTVAATLVQTGSHSHHLQVQWNLRCVYRCAITGPCCWRPLPSLCLDFMYGRLATESSRRIASLQKRGIRHVGTSDRSSLPLSHRSSTGFKDGGNIAAIETRNMH